MFVISKSFEFAAAHSVHSQRLNREWAGSDYPKCRRLPGHGHNYKLTVYLTGELSQSQMVTDFGHLKWLKEFIDDCFDHKLIIGVDDPAFELFFSKLELLDGKEIKFPFETRITIVDENFRLKSFFGRSLTLRKISTCNFVTFGSSPLQSDPILDFYQRLVDGIVLFKGSPTSENLARFFYYFVKENVKPLGVDCYKVSINETPNSCASYSER
ncbi:6-pyruvoyltetrahydropterin/6-carboxytetrahydropterin synthase [Thermovibrio guaymasensis]|uniref:6-carboxy-5,6,7,8-tetrahydropterin synthase n=1 Tax=Thermovibrio guaymasensis TaxID=240167 RepID=A0A420W9P6_9BACT|nr:6-carboxytetrahydropterin synthase [Thermovibrio guaymasensis]RKQ64053.1 6-pyruvoyltetrahydropterin/6-carboxytetrahydropterin synthase [Thermovibrio guaymasensis]